jgi:hypothetical protein
MPEFLPFRIQTDSKGESAAIIGNFPVPIDQVPDLEQSRRAVLVDLEKGLVAQGLPESLATKRDQLNALINEIDQAAVEAKESLHRCLDDRDALWNSGTIPTVGQLEKFDAAADAIRQRLKALAENRDKAAAKLDDLATEISREVGKAARAAIAQAVEFSGQERKAIDGLLAHFKGDRLAALLAACLRQRLAYDFSQQGGWLGTVDSISAKAVALLLAPAAQEPEPDAVAEESDLAEVAA